MHFLSVAIVPQEGEKGKVETGGEELGRENGREKSSPRWFGAGAA